jgi:hypothetical protein
MEKIRCNQYGGNIEFKVAVQYFQRNQTCNTCIDFYDKCKEAKEQIEIDKDNLPCEHLVNNICSFDELDGCEAWAKWDKENPSLDSNDFCKLSKLVRDKFK